MEEGRNIGASAVQLVNDVVRDVCLNGKSLADYRSALAESFPDSDVYAQIEEFVTAFDAVKRGDTEVDAAFLDLRTLAQHICLTADTVNAVVTPLRSVVRRPEPQAVAPRRAPSVPAAKPSATKPERKPSRFRWWLALILLLAVVLLILYFNSK